MGAVQAIFVVWRILVTIFFLLDSIACIKHFVLIWNQFFVSWLIIEIFWAKYWENFIFFRVALCCESFLLWVGECFLIRGRLWSRIIGVLVHFVHFFQYYASFLNYFCFFSSIVSIDVFFDNFHVDNFFYSLSVFGFLSMYWIL